MKKNFFLATAVVVTGFVMLGIAIADVNTPLAQGGVSSSPTTSTAPVAVSAGDVGSGRSTVSNKSSDNNDGSSSSGDNNAQSTTTTAAPATQASAAQDASAIDENAFGSTPTAREAFTRVLRSLIPMNPNQIVTLRSLFDQSQKAVTQFPGVPPKPTSSSIIVNISPGATPPVIRLRQGYVTSLVFLDSTGQPWPIVGYDLGDPHSFNIQPSAPDGKSNMLLIQSLVRYEQGNLAVMLQGQNTPVMLTLIPGQRAVDYRVDLRVPGLGPNATVLSEGLPSAENPVLLDFLDGTPPQGAKQLTVEGPPTQAWSYQNSLFLRTRLTVLSPAWLATMSSPDGTRVYEMTASPIILAAERGKMVQLSVKGL